MIFNELTRAIIFMSNEEFNDVFNVDRFEYLYRNYFIVPEDFNEMEVTDKASYTINFSLVKDNKKWVLEKISDSDLEKIHGLYED